MSNIGFDAAGVAFLETGRQWEELSPVEQRKIMEITSDSIKPEFKQVTLAGTLPHGVGADGVVYARFHCEQDAQEYMLRRNR